jgi:Lysozyme like domain
MFEVWRQPGLSDTLSPAQIAAVAASAGCPSSQIPNAVAIAMGESSGNTAAHNPSGEDSWGLWQINRRAHPEYAVSTLTDPAGNAAAMMAISGGCQNWQPWGAFTNGSYRKYLPAATDAAGNPDSSSSGGPADTGSGFDFASLSPLLILAIVAAFLL